MWLNLLNTRYHPVARIRGHEYAERVLSYDVVWAFPTGDEEIPNWVRAVGVDAPARVADYLATLGFTDVAELWPAWRARQRRGRAKAKGKAKGKPRKRRQGGGKTAK